MDDAEFDALMARYVARQRRSGLTELVSATADAGYAKAQEYVNAAARERYVAADAYERGRAAGAAEARKTLKDEAMRGVLNSGFLPPVGDPTARYTAVTSTGAFVFEGAPDKGGCWRRLGTYKAAIGGLPLDGSMQQGLAADCAQAGQSPQRPPGIGSGVWSA